MLRTEVLHGADLFERLLQPWQALALDSTSASPFQTWEWQSTWWRHYGGRKKPRAVALYDGHDLIGLMALVKTSGPWRSLRSLGIGPSDYLHPLMRDGYEASTYDAVANYAAEVSDVDLVDLHQVRETYALARPQKELAPLDQAVCLVMDLPRSYDLYLGGLGKSLRYDIKKLDKTLFQTGRAKIESLPPDRVQEGFEVFLRQHKARWRKRGLPGAFLGRTVGFHRDWIDLAARNGWLRMGLLVLEGEVAGAIYAMSFGNTMYYYQAGFDPSKASYSPGNLLVAHTIRTAIEEGKQRFDFMRGDEPYKRRWKPQHCWKNQRLILVKDNVRGTVGGSWNRRGSEIETRLRTKLEGKGLLS